MTSSDQVSTQTKTSTDVNEIKMTAEEYESRIKAAQEEVEQASAQAVTLRVELDSIVKSKTNLESQLDEASRQARNAEEAHKAAVEDLNKKNVNAISEWNKAEDQARVYEQRIKEVEAERSRYKDSMQEMTDKKGSLELEIQKSKDETNALQAKLRQLEDDLMRVEAERQKIADQAAADKIAAAQTVTKHMEQYRIAEMELREAYATLEKESKALGADPCVKDKCVAMQTTISELTHEVTQYKENLKKEKAEVRELTSARKREREGREADLKMIKDLEKKLGESQVARKKKEQDEWDSTDKQVKALDQTLEQARKMIRDEFAQRIKELEDKVRDSESQQNSLKGQLAAAQRDLVSSRRKAKKMQQNSVHTSEKVLVAPEPSDVSAIAVLAKKVNTMPGYYWIGGVAIMLALAQMFFPSLMKVK